MKLAGLLLLLSGWAIVIAAIRMLHGGALSGVVLAGFGVEIAGLALLVRTHIPSGEVRE
jgi:membrane-bound ClpP family serine protease